jgi:hypothetical protein
MFALRLTFSAFTFEKCLLQHSLLAAPYSSILIAGEPVLKVWLQGEAFFKPLRFCFTIKMIHPLLSKVILVFTNPP